LAEQVVQVEAAIEIGADAADTVANVRLFAHFSNGDIACGS
jgi:hypothetical protein